VKNLKFKAWVVEHGIQQAEIAKLLHISLQLVNAKLNGREPWTLEQVKILCEHYKISADIYFI